MTVRDWLWNAFGVALATVLLAALADWRRSRRRNLDNPGWVPWRGIQVAGFFAAVLLAVLAVRS